MIADFGRWFANQKPAEEPSVPEEEMLPEGLDQHADGTYWAKCRSCDCYYEVDYDPKDFTEEYSYCGGSQYCVP